MEDSELTVEEELDPNGDYSLDEDSLEEVEPVELDIQLIDLDVEGSACYVEEVGE